MALALPPVGPALIALAGLLLARRSPVWGLRICFLGVLSILLFSLPVVAQCLQRLLYSAGPIALEHAREHAQAIVILGGGVRRSAAEYGGDTLGGLTLERTRYGAYLAKRIDLPVLVAGGSSGSQMTEAELMAQVLREEYGVDVRWQERASRNTRENAINSVQILRASNIGTIVLVTHGFDVPRAQSEFAARGIKVIPAPTGIAMPSAGPPAMFPSASALQSSYFACYELLANLARVLGVP